MPFISETEQDFPSNTFFFNSAVWFKHSGSLPYASSEGTKSKISIPSDGKNNKPRSFPAATYNDAKTFKSSALKDNKDKAGVYR